MRRADGPARYAGRYPEGDALSLAPIQLLLDEIHRPHHQDVPLKQKWPAPSDKGDGRQSPRQGTFEKRYPTV
jgi:hypothetical protein